MLVMNEDLKIWEDWYGEYECTTSPNCNPGVGPTHKRVSGYYFIFPWPDKIGGPPGDLPPEPLYYWTLTSVPCKEPGMILLCV